MTVTLIAALTVDGFIARHATDRSFDWTSPEDKRQYVSELKQADAIIMGAKTFDTFSRYPQGSDWYIYTRKPEAFTNPKPEIITAQAVSTEPTALIEQLRAQGKTKVLVCGGAQVYSLFMKAGVIDRLLLTVESVVFGQGISLFSSAHEQTLKLESFQALTPHTTVFEYSVLKK